MLAHQYLRTKRAIRSISFEDVSICARRLVGHRKMAVIGGVQPEYRRSSELARSHSVLPKSSSARGGPESRCGGNLPNVAEAWLSDKIEERSLSVVRLIPSRKSAKTFFE